MNLNPIDLKERIVVSGVFTPEERNFLLAAVNARLESPEMVTVIHDPGSNLGRLDAIYAYLSINDGGEGICGVNGLPLIAAEKRLMDMVKPTVRNMVHMTNKPIRLVKFKQREDLEIFR